MAVAPDQITSILATDCGSTTTKAILIERRPKEATADDPRDYEYRLRVRGEAPTTVEAPFEDVTKGVLNAAKEVEELRGRAILDGDDIVRPRKDDTGVDIYISTSSAGGGLQMMVGGVVMSMTGESAQRAALGAGAIVMDAIASNDGRLPYEKIERIRNDRPDMILLAGGVDGGTVSHVSELAEIIAAANPRPRFGSTYRLPVIFAGNKKARGAVEDALADKADLSSVDNVRPVLEQENLGPARDAIHELFMEHVMAQAPGYKKLMEWTDAPIMPTPGAVGEIIKAVAARDNINVVGVDIGGATTDVFSVFETVFNRTVSANLGMSYSVSNVLAEAGLENIGRWLPFDVDERDLRNRIKNKMIRPTTIPQTLEDLIVEQAIAREALRLSFVQHKEFAVTLKGVQQARTISEAFDQSVSGQTIVNMATLDLLVGSGGVLSHAPRRHQSAMMMIDAFEPTGVTRLAVDSIFMMPHLGVLSTVHPEAATEVFEKDCLVHLGPVIAPVGGKRVKAGEPCVTVEVDGTAHAVPAGELRLVELPYETEAAVEITPERGFDVGAGLGEALTTRLRGGVVGLVIDTRGRPIRHGATPEERKNAMSKWTQAMNAYPKV